MKLIPAIDIVDNKCVRLSKGKEDSIHIYNTNPIEQAKFFEKEGCERIHIIDLDAAFGRRDVNKQTILDIRKSISIPIELGGGIKNINDIFYWFNNNIDFLIIGSLAIKDYENVISISKDFENFSVGYGYKLQENDLNRFNLEILLDNTGENEFVLDIIDGLSDNQISENFPTAIFKLDKDLFRIDEQNSSYYINYFNVFFELYAEYNVKYYSRIWKTLDLEEGLIDAIKIKRALIK